MYTLGIPKRDYRRATQVLGYESQPNIPFEADLKDDGFYIFSFPEADEFDFRKIVKLLDKEEVRTIGGDTALTEKKIMKLADLITEAPTLQELEEPTWLNKLKRTCDIWQTKQYQDDKNKHEMFYEDIKELIEQWEESLNQEKKQREEQERGVTKSLAESKLRKLIRKTIRE